MSTIHEIFRKKLISVKYQVRRRCWTEICRKVDGVSKKEGARHKKKEEESPKHMCHPYTSSCFELFIV